jgi:hypothetical protein
VKFIGDRNLGEQKGIFQIYNEIEEIPFLYDAKLII